MWRKMYFLKKVCFLVKDEQGRQGVEELINKNRTGDAEYVMELQDALPDSLKCAKTDLKAGKGQRFVENDCEILPNAAWENGTDIEKVLWVTDCVAWGLQLQQTGQAVLMYLHEGNGRDDYSAFRYAMMHPEELDLEYFELIYRRIKRLPWDILETERLYLRESMVEDVDAFYEIYKEPAITAYMENLFPTREEERTYINDYIDKVYAFYDFGIWTVVEKASSKVIGRVGLSYREGYEEPELGFVIGVPWQGRGYAYEVCTAVLDYGRCMLGFERVQAFVKPGNKASIALCEKLGFTECERPMLDGEEHIRFIQEL